MLEGLRTDEETVQRVIILQAYGCPLQAIVHAFGLDERTVAAWQKRAGNHCKHIHEEIVQLPGCCDNLSTVHVLNGFCSQRKLLFSLASFARVTLS